MRYLVKDNLYNRAGDRIAEAGKVIRQDDLPVANRVSIPWLIEQGYLVEQPDPPPAPTPAAKPQKE
jgi:hypothetical protein